MFILSCSNGLYGKMCLIVFKFSFDDYYIKKKVIFYYYEG